MDTVETAVDYLRHNQTPFWWVFSGSSKIAESTNTDNLDDSITRFRDAARFWPAGSYKLECSDKASNRSGSFKFPFTKGQTTATQLPMQPAQQSNNVYGIPDAVLSKIVDETRQKILVEQMHADFVGFFKEWPEYKKKIDKMYDHLLDKDSDGDGTPDLMETARKGSEIVKNVADVKKVFEGGSIFG